jgi:hypothetical protein
VFPAIVACLLRIVGCNLLQILFFLYKVSEIVMVCLAGGSLAAFVWCIWSVASSPLTQLKLQSRRKRWQYEIDLDGLWYKIRGTTDNLCWEAYWNGRLLNPVFELTAFEGVTADHWVFLRLRRGREVSISTLLAHAFTGRVQPAWVIGLSQAREVRTNLPEFDREFLLAAAGYDKTLQMSVSPEYLARLKNLPQPVLVGLMIIWGEGKLRVRVEGFRGGAGFAPIEQLLELARQSLQQLHCPSDRDSNVETPSTPGIRYESSPQ